MPTTTCFSFDSARLQAQAEQYADAYDTAPPFPHTVIDGLLPDAVAREIYRRFPKPDAPYWFDPKSHDPRYQDKKLGIGNASRLEGIDPFLLSVLWAFNSHPFLRFLEKLTGIEKLISDPHYFGGGMHQILPGGSLKIHADFNFLPELNLYRKINVLFYLNPDWKEEYGGYLELWDKGMKHPVQRIAPLLNRCVVFNTHKYSYHGHPDPLTCPKDMTRKSMAFYYYTTEPWPDDLDHHSTLWQKRPGRD